MGKGMGGEEGEGTKFKKENKTKQKKEYQLTKEKSIIGSKPKN